MTTAPDITHHDATKKTLEVGTPTQFRWLNGVVKTVVVMNLIDAVLTLLWVRAGFATEANLLLRDVVDHHAIVFVMGKLALVSLATALLWRAFASERSMLATPKSVTRTRSSVPMRTLSGLKSRWTRPASCAAASPCPA